MPFYVDPPTMEKEDFLIMCGEKVQIGYFQINDFNIILNNRKYYVLLYPNTQPSKAVICASKTEYEYLVTDCHANPDDYKDIHVYVVPKESVEMFIS